MGKAAGQRPLNFIPQTSPVGANAGLPSNALGMKAYDPKDYRHEIAIGKRRDTGVLKLKRLTGRHIAILKLHLLGLSNNEVAERFGVSPPIISKVINDPLGQAYLQNSYNDLDNEFEALYGESVQVIRQGFKADRMADRLRTLDIYYKKRGDYNEPTRTDDTAEDVIQRVLNMQINVNVGGDKQLPNTEIKILENKDE